MRKPQAFVIGMGEVGRRLATALEAAGWPIVRVTREFGWEQARATTPGARIVCVGEEQLAAVVADLRGVPPERLVFVQNGWIRPLLAGLRGYTRGLIWFTSKGPFFRTLRVSPFCGPLAADLAAALAAGGLAAEAVADAPFSEADAEKMGFNCVVGLPLVVRHVTLAEYLARHAAEARAVFDEATSVTAHALGIAARAQWWPEFLRSAEPLDWVSSRAPKALAFRNGAVVRLAAELGLDAPANARLVAEAGAG